MRRAFGLFLLPVTVCLLHGADASWKAKPVSQWNGEDAVAVFAASPWVKYTTPQWIPDIGSEAAHRDSGDWQAGRPASAGLAGIGILWGSQRAAEARALAQEKPTPDVVVIRWESALPLRVAKEKIGATEVPLVDENHYAVVVYGIPIVDRPHTAKQLKGIAFIKRPNKKDFRPSSVQVLPRGDGKADVVYLFPRSQEITKKDGTLTFVSQIGRLFIAQDFSTDDMQIRGTLEL
jgi:hypothetical protein